jgi:hypothetical protein
VNSATRTNARRARLNEEIVDHLGDAGIYACIGGDMQDDKDGGGLTIALSWRQAYRLLRVLRGVRAGKDGR